MAKSNIAQTVDALGEIKARIAELTAHEKKLKAVLIEAGLGAHLGLEYDATVSESERETLDMDAVRAKLSPQFIAAHTRTSKVTTVRVVAKVADRKAA